MGYSIEKSGESPELEQKFVDKIDVQMCKCADVQMCRCANWRSYLAIVT